MSEIGIFQQSCWYDSSRMVDTALEQERIRLERVYADMSESELRVLEEDAASLTSEATQALRAEIFRRGLNISAPTWHPGRKPTSPTEFTTRKGIAMLGIFAGAGLALILLVLRFPQWFSHCVRPTPPWW
jgi:hypothetical protein